MWSSAVAALALTGAALGAAPATTVIGPPRPPWATPTVVGVAGTGAQPPPRATMAPPDPATCPATSHGAVVDRANQRAWLCTDGVIVRVMPITSARSQPDPGVYAVYAEDMVTTSYYGPRPSTLDRFVAFTYGEEEGARVAFHAVPRYSDDTLAQPLESVGTQARFGDSSGCIRVRPVDSVAIWDHLSVGDEVHVVS
jgi:hypothetical protein